MKKKINKNTKSYQKKLAKKELKLLDKVWSNNIKLRDENKCVICGDSKLLHTHHILPRELKSTRHLFSNGVTLCPRHHKYSFEISAHKNSFAFFIWFMNNRPEQYKILVDYNNENGKQISRQI